MVVARPVRIPGPWREGWALDVHTLASRRLGDDASGRPVFETRRTEVGELLYRLKYEADGSVLPAIVAVAVAHLRLRGVPIDVVVPVPASRRRRVQPVVRLAAALASALGARCEAGAVRRTRVSGELKDVRDPAERARLLDGAFDVDEGVLRGMRVLVVDDLYRSGASLRGVAEIVLGRGGAAEVSALAVTRTRRHR